MKRIGLFAVICILTSSALAWSWQGHKVVGAIAASELSPQAEEQVRLLLDDETLADVSTWADEIKRDPEWRYLNSSHYINVPRTETEVNMERDCPDGKCVVAAIQNFERVLRDPESSRRKKSEALKFLVHFVGDVHQPLHVSFADDVGGNKTILTFAGSPDWKLHAIWDTGIIYECTTDWPALAIRSRMRIDEKELAKLRADLDPVSWANDSLAITHEVYRNLPVNRVLSDDYAEKQIAVVEVRLAAAGIHLGALLNDIFAESDSK